MKKALLLSMLAISVLGMSQLHAEDIGISAITSPEKGTKVNPLVPFKLKATVKNYDDLPMLPDLFKVYILLDGAVVDSSLHRNENDIPKNGTYDIEMELVLGQIEKTSGDICLVASYSRDGNKENDQSPECLSMNFDSDRNFDIELKNVVVKTPTGVVDGAKIKGGDQILEIDYELHNAGSITLPIGTALPLVADMASVVVRPITMFTTKELKPGEFEKFNYARAPEAPLHYISAFPDVQGAVFKLCFKAAHDFDANADNDEICWQLEVDGSVNSGLTEAEMDRIEVYAQPSGLTVDLEGLEGQENMEMLVMNVHGQVVHSQTVSYGQLTQIELSPALKHNMLIVALESRGSRFVKKVIIP